jgi:hypothetical protein
MRRTLLLVVLVGSLSAAMLSWPAAAQQPTPTMELDLVSEIGLGQPVDIEVYLRDSDGSPIPGETVTLAVDVGFMNVLDTADIGWALTDEDGLATVVFTPKSDGELFLTARFSGGEKHRAVEEFGSLMVTPGPATYEEPTPFRIPGANITIVVAVLITVWAMYLVFVGFLWMIAHDVPVDRADAEAGS